MAEEVIEVVTRPDGTKNIQVNVVGCEARLYNALGLVDSGKSPIEFRTGARYAILEVVVNCYDKYYYKLIPAKNVLKIVSVTPLVVEVESLEADRADIYLVAEGQEVLIGSIYPGMDKFTANVAEIINRLGLAGKDVKLKAIFYHADAITVSNTVPLNFPTRGSVEIGTGLQVLTWSPIFGTLTARDEDKEKLGTQYVENNTDNIVSVVMGYDKSLSGLVSFKPGTWPASFLYLNLGSWEFESAKPLVVKTAKKFYADLTGSNLPVVPKIAILKPKQEILSVKVDGQEVQFTTENKEGQEQTESPEQFIMLEQELREFGDLTDFVQNLIQKATLLDEEGSTDVYVQICTTECSKAYKFEAPEPWTPRDLSLWRRPILYFTLEPNMDKIEVKKALSDEITFYKPTVVYDGRVGVVVEPLSSSARLFTPSGLQVAPGVQLAQEMGVYTVVGADEYHVYYILDVPSPSNTTSILVVKQTEGMPTVAPKIQVEKNIYPVRAVVVMARDSAGFWSYWVLRPVVVAKDLEVQGKVVKMTLNVDPNLYGIKLCNQSECVSYQNGEFIFREPPTHLYFSSPVPVVDENGDEFYWSLIENALQGVSFSMPSLKFSVATDGRDEANIILVVEDNGVKKTIPVLEKAEICNGCSINIAKYLTDADKLNAVIVYNRNGIRLFTVDAEIKRPSVKIENNQIVFDLGDWNGIAQPYIRDCKGEVYVGNSVSLNMLNIECGEIPHALVKYGDKLVRLSNGLLEYPIYDAVPTVSVYHNPASSMVHITVAVPELIRNSIMMIQVVKHPDGDVVAEFADVESIQTSGTARIDIPAEVGSYAVQMWLAGKVVPIARFSILPEIEAVGNLIMVRGADVKNAKVYKLDPLSDYNAVEDKSKTEELREKGQFTVDDIGHYILDFGSIKVPVIVYGVAKKGSRLEVYDIFEHSKIRCVVGCTGVTEYNDSRVAVFSLGLLPVVILELDGRRKVLVREGLAVAEALLIGTVAGVGITVLKGGAVKLL